VYFSLSITSGAVKPPISKTNKLYEKKPTHIADCADTPPDHLPFGNLDRQAKVRDSNVAVIIKQNVLRFAVSVDYSDHMQVFKTTQHLETFNKFKKV